MSKVISNFILTEVDFPKFKIISKESSDINFRGEHSVRYTIKFKEMPSDDFYKQVDSIILKHKNDERGLFYTPGWYKKDTINYSYNKLWFGSPPKGLDVGNHMQVTIDLNRNSNIAEISYCEM